LASALPLALAAVLALAATRAQADPYYTITNLGPRSGAALNNLGDVVGNTGTVFTNLGAPYIYHSYGAAAGTFTNLSGLLGTSTYLNDINDSGQIIGTMTTPVGYHGFVDSGGQVTLIPTSAAAPYSFTAGISNSGAVIGTDYGTYSGPGPAPGGGFLYSRGQTIDLGFAMIPRAISGAGNLVGQANGNDEVYLYQNGHWNHAAGGDPSAINNAGQVVGQYVASLRHLPDGSNVTSWHAFLYQNGQFTDLGTLGGFRSWASAINSQGQVVGTSDVTSIPYDYGHAFLYQNGTMTDLNKLIAPSSGWTLQSARAINDKGQILGYGVSPSGEQDTFLLTPASEPPPIAPEVPEPNTLAFFALAAAAMALRRAWRRC
jgi:probable HAF family extracellular repeat protein